MLCKIDKADAPVMNVLSDQAFNAIGGGVQAAIAMLAMSGKTPCFATSALVQAMANQFMTSLLAHRQSHDQHQDCKQLGSLKKNPEAFLALVEDANEIFAAVLRGIDPKHDYMLNVFKVEKPAASEEKHG